MNKDKLEFFKKFTTEDVDSNGDVPAGTQFMVDHPYLIWAWIESKKAEWQREAREEVQRERLALEDSVTQFISDSKGRNYELAIHKNDPKSGNSDYWCCWYGDSDIYLSGYYSLSAMLEDLRKEVHKKGYIFNY